MGILDFGKNLRLEIDPRVYFTQEGTPYVLKRAAQTIPAYAPIVENIYFVAVFNGQNDTITWKTTNPNGTILIDNCPNSIVPVMFNLHMIERLTGFVQASFALPWYFTQSNYSLTTGDFKNLKPLAKTTAQVELIQANGGNSYIYNTKLDKISLVDDDFIEANGSIAVIFEYMPCHAYTNRPFPFPVVAPAASPVDIAMTVTYFELQKK